MSSFTQNLTLTYLPKTNTWVTEREFTYYVGKKGSDDKVMVPKGFHTDLASVPWPASMIIPKSGRGNQAAVLHDYLYYCHDRERKNCDCIFLESMKVLGVSWWKRKTMYRAVRSFGWIPWKKHKKRSIKNEKDS